MLCDNCRLIFDQEVIEKTEWDDGYTTTYTATYSYTTTYHDFLLATNKCNCCLQMLYCFQRNAEDEDDYVSSEEDDHVLSEEDDHIPSEEDDHVPSEEDDHVSSEEELHFKMEQVWVEEYFSKDWEATLCISAYAVHGCLSGSTEFNVVRRKDWEIRQLNSAIHSASPNNTGSAYTAEFVKNCLERCKWHSHSPYYYDDRPQWYPTRLVEVLDDGEAKLVETSETTPAGPYATLSHCWGTSGTFTTTTKNIADLKKRIPFLDLPKTFRDALHFAKSIGVSLIWIDSLCIIQDSAEDWESESRTMLQVYQHAECNLAATASEDSHAGLFSERNYASLPSGWFEVDNNIPKLKGIFSVVPIRYFRDAFDRELWTSELVSRGTYFRDAFDREVGNSRLLSRGWVYQERAASRRVVAFGRDYVFWDCPQRLESDVLPGYDASKVWKQSSFEQARMAVPKCTTPAVSRSTLSWRDDAFSAWKKIVQVYSACDFTYITDKPIAILGMAEMMGLAQQASYTDDNSGWEGGPEFIPYWGGLWLRDMCRQLAWKVSRSGLRRNSCAPSWSWLSIEGPVEWQDFYLAPAPTKDGLERKMPITSALATIAWSDQQSKETRLSFNEVSSDLKIWCGLHTFRVTDPEGSWDGGSYRREPSEQLLYMTSSRGIGLELKPNDLDCEDIDVETLYFLPLIYDYKNHEPDNRYVYGFEKHLKVVGILVQPTDDQVGTYRRCGSASYSLPIYLYPYSQVTEVLKGLYQDKNAWVRRKFRLSRPPPSDVGFSYQKYDPELGYLVRII